MTVDNGNGNDNNINLPGAIPVQPIGQDQIGIGSRLQPTQKQTIQNLELPVVPETQNCIKCGAIFNTKDLVRNKYLVQCCDKPTFPTKYPSALVFPDEFKQNLEVDTNKGIKILAMRYEDRGYDSSIESGKGKDNYKVYYNPDDPKQSQSRIVVAAFLKQLQTELDKQALIELMISRNFNVQQVLDQIEVKLKTDEKEEDKEVGVK